jgi:hypothetical protein
MPSKTTKIPTKFHQPTTTEKRSHVSSQRDLGSTKSSLPKGWVYEVEEVSVEVKAEVVDLCKYLMLDTPLTHRKRQLLETEDAQLQDPYCQHCWASNITEAPPIFHSASKKTAVKHRRGISGPISTLPNPFVEGRLSLDGPTYHSEIHAAAVHDVDIPPPLLPPNYFGFFNSTIWGMTAWTRCSANSVIDL